LPSQSGAASSLNPDPLAVLLSLSIRDGLSGGSFFLWPWLAAIQVVLLLTYAVAFGAKRIVTASKKQSE
jgi:hypothetical protein